MRVPNSCILTRRGNKRRIAEQIIRYFPPHRLYIEPFFGAGGLFFAKEKAPFNLLNDKDEEVYNLFQVVLSRTRELVALWERTPVHQRLFDHWKRHPESNPLRRALRFLFLSNLSILGGLRSMRFFNGGTKRLFLERVHDCQRTLADCEFLCTDFRKVLALVKGSARKRSAFVYCDPPYLDTEARYTAGDFAQQDSLDLLDLLQRSGMRFAMSEFDHPFILREAVRRKLHVRIIGERQNLRNRRTEILVMNYDPDKVQE